MTGEMLLNITDLTTAFDVKDEIIPILNKVSFHIEKGESLGVVGESGSGKSVTALSIMGLLPANAHVLNGQIRYRGDNLLRMPANTRRRLRGEKMAMIFQEPMTSLNPVYTIGVQIMELLRAHKKMNKKQAFNWSVEMLDKVGIPDPRNTAKRYPHELSGGMRQRVVIAMAIALSPELLIADEPTTALDVSIQAQILELIKSLQIQMKMATMLITHDLGVVAGMCRRVVVMYAGEVAEIGPAGSLFTSPLHPYTQALLQSIPRLDTDKEFLSTIKGMVPHPRDMLQGCRFADRCERAMDRCFHEKPPPVEPSGHALVCCWLHCQGR